MIEPAVLPLVIYQGATFSKTFITDNFSFTGYSAIMQIRDKVDEKSRLLIELTTNNGGIIIKDAPLGEENKLTINISAQQTKLLNIKECVYELAIIKNEEVIKLFRGNISVIAGVIS